MQVGKLGLKTHLSFKQTAPSAELKKTKKAAEGTKVSTFIALPSYPYYCFSSRHYPYKHSEIPDFFLLSDISVPAIVSQNILQTRILPFSYPIPPYMEDDFPIKYILIENASTNLQICTTLLPMGLFSAVPCWEELSVNSAALT